METAAPQAKCLAWSSWQQRNGIAFEYRDRRHFGDFPPTLLPVFHPARPVLTQEPRERTIRKDFPPGLAARAIVRFMLTADDPLNQAAARRTGLPELAVDGEVRPKCGDVARPRKAMSELGEQAISKANQDLARDVKEAAKLLRVEIGRPLSRGEPRGVENLIRVGVPDASKGVRIGECPFEGARVRGERRDVRLEGAFQRLEPAGIHRREGLSASADVKRRPLLVTRLGHAQRAACEEELSRDDLPWSLGQRRLRLVPAKAPRDQEVENEEPLPVQLKDDAFPKPFDAAYPEAFQRFDGRINASQDRGAEHPRPFERASRKALSKTSPVRLDVGKLGHGRSILLPPTYSSSGSSAL